MKKMEPIFDVLYLVAGAVMGVIMLLGGGAAPLSIWGGITALTLIFGDSFHLVPRISAAFSDDAEKYQKALGRGKQVTSVTMTFFYLLLWHTVTQYCPAASNKAVSACLYLLAAVRIILCLCPQNRWTESDAPLRWSVYRNVPFFIMGATVVIFSFLYRAELSCFGFLWLAVLLSFAFYAPVTLGAHKYKMLGMLMLPKTCMYVWILVMLTRM